MRCPRHLARPRRAGRYPGATRPLDEPEDGTGPWKYYFRNGRLKAAGKYLDGLLEGPWKWYRESGKLLQTGSFEAGKQTGLWKRYRENGKLHDAGEFANGKKTGVWKQFDDKGELLRTKKH